MPSSTNQSPRRSRLLRRGILVTSSVVTLFFLYFASIGPLTFLESQGIGSQSTYELLHGTVYYPIFRSWERGPKWVSSTLRTYVCLFVPKGKTPNLQRCFAADSNDYWRWYHFWSQAMERKLLANPGYVPGSPIPAADAKQANLDIKDLL